MKTMTGKEFEQRQKGLKSLEDVKDLLKDMVAPTVQAMLEGEMEAHLGYKKHDVKGNNTGNSRNGYTSKKLQSEYGVSEITIPRDRNSEFESSILDKYQTRDPGIDDQIIALYASGMTTRDINNHMNRLYGVNVSPGMISAITDKVFPLIKEWQARPLENIYPIVYADALHFRVRDNGKIISKAAYIIIGIDISGKKDILGIWIGENEGSKFWLSVFNEIKNRGVEDIFICCIDGLTGFPDAIRTVFPETEIQLCIIHQIRNTLKYVSWRDRKEFCNDLKTVYQAPSEEAALEALQLVKEKWSQYTMYLKSWEEKWTDISTFFVYPSEIRKIIYTTNAIESLNRQFRKVTKTTTIFPHNEAVLKLLWLAQRDITKKWKVTLRNWPQILAQFNILFPNRLKF